MPPNPASTRCEELPVTLGNHLDAPVGHHEGGLVVDRVCRDGQVRRPPLSVRQRGVWVILVVPVRDQREVDQSHSFGRDEGPAATDFTDPLWIADHGSSIGSVGSRR